MPGQPVQPGPMPSQPSGMPAQPGGMQTQPTAMQGQPNAMQGQPGNMQGQQQYGGNFQQVTSFVPKTLTLAMCISCVRGVLVCYFLNYTYSGTWIIRIQNTREFCAN